MIDKISKWILDLISNSEQTNEEKEILLFGITRIVEDIPKTIGIVLIGISLGIIKEIAIVTLIILLYKTLTGGAIRSRSSPVSVLCTKTFPTRSRATSRHSRW